MTRLEPLSAELLEARVRDLIALDRGIEAEPWGEPEFRLPLAEKLRHSRLAFDDSRLVGFAVASRKGDAVHLHRLVVAPSERGRGLGRDLVLAVAASGRASGLPRMTLKVHTGNRDGRAFYARLGFREESTAGANVCLVTETGILVGAPGVGTSG